MMAALRGLIHEAIAWRRHGDDTLIFRHMWIVALNTGIADTTAFAEVPVAIHAAVGALIPVAPLWAVALTAQLQ